MSMRLNDSLALTLSALLVEVMADNADDPRLLPLCVLLEGPPRLLILAPEAAENRSLGHQNALAGEIGRPRSRT